MISSRTGCFCAIAGLVVSSGRCGTTRYSEGVYVMPSATILANSWIQCWQEGSDRANISTQCSEPHSGGFCSANVSQ